jgi:hypothetical protein
MSQRWRIGAGAGVDLFVVALAAGWVLSRGSDYFAGAISGMVCRSNRR